MNFKSISLTPLRWQLRASYDSLIGSNIALALLTGSNPLQKANTQRTLWFPAQRWDSCISGWKWKWSRVRLFATPRTVVYQAPLSMGFSREEYWSRVPLPSPLQGIFPTQGSNLGLLHCRQMLYHLSHQGTLVNIKNANLIAFITCILSRGRVFPNETFYEMS